VAQDHADRLPIIRAWDQIVVPLQGEISDALAERIRDQVLYTIRDTGAEGLIIDITGVWMMDSHLCSVISNIAASARIMGTICIICGMSAQIALTLHAMGIDLGNVRTALTLEEAFASLGIGRVGKSRARLAGDEDDEDQEPEESGQRAPARRM
jgi:rsbT antagonist protein RsbS